jgi:hypothetical protein
MDPSALEARELFHLEFLRAFTRVARPAEFALKGGSNLRFFFGSIRYSEDMDLDLQGLPIHEVTEKVMKILTAPALSAVLSTFGIERIGVPDLASAKQTATVQRFKVHLFTQSGLDLFTKIEFSRRGLDSPFRAEPVAPAVLTRYRLAPLIVPHYLAVAALRQKVRALASRKQVEPRDIFDLYTLSTQPEAGHPASWSQLESAQLAEARERIFLVSYPQYRDKVVAFLAPEEQATYESEALWDEIRLRVEGLLAEGMKAQRRAKKEAGS